MTPKMLIEALSKLPNPDTELDVQFKFVKRRKSESLNWGTLTGFDLYFKLLPPEEGQYFLTIAVEAPY